MSFFLFLAITLVLGLGALSIILPQQNKRKEIADPSLLRSIKWDCLFTPAELNFYKILESALADQVKIFAKVRMSDVLSAAPELSKSQKLLLRNKTKQKHFDFVLCEPLSLKIIAAIELDDQSHARAERIQRDQEVDAMCQSANLPLFHYSAKAAYPTQQIKDEILGKLGIMPEPTTPSPITNTDTHEIKSAKQCPKCKSALIQRMAQKGNYKGQMFLACSAYPKCRHLEATSEPN